MQSIIDCFGQTANRRENRAEFGCKRLERYHCAVNASDLVRCYAMMPLVSRYVVVSYKRYTLDSGFRNQSVNHKQTDTHAAAAFVGGRFRRSRSQPPTPASTHPPTPRRSCRGRTLRAAARSPPTPRPSPRSRDLQGSPRTRTRRCRAVAATRTPCRRSWPSPAAPHTETTPPAAPSAGDPPTVASCTPTRHLAATTHTRVVRRTSKCLNHFSCIL